MSASMTFEPWGTVPGTYLVTSERSGNTYRLHLGEPGDMCTCPGFQRNQFRRGFKSCRHLTEARARGLERRVYVYRSPARSQ